MESNRPLTEKEVRRMFEAQDLSEANRLEQEIRQSQPQDEPNYSVQDVPPGAEIVIEYPSAGTTYERDEYGVYAYDEYPASSVLAGQQRRRFLASFETLEDAQQAYPMASGPCGSGYQPPSLNHLPGDDDAAPHGEDL